MLQPMKNQRTRPAPKPKPFGERKKSRRDHNQEQPQYNEDY